MAQKRTHWRLTTHFRLWHIAEVPPASRDFRFRALSGYQNGGSRLPLMTRNGHSWLRSNAEQTNFATGTVTGSGHPSPKCGGQLIGRLETIGFTKESSAVSGAVLYIGRAAQYGSEALDTTAKLGRFDQSFIVKMITDFFVLLLVVGILELGIRFFLVLYDFYGTQAEITQVAADRLAADIRKIMVNRGGPVAARTLYPILTENHNARGLEIAIAPSRKTIDSIKQRFDFTPRGIPSDWPQGRHHEVSIIIRAEQFCLSCHTKAKVGDPLGTITVRSYLSESLTLWWTEVRLSGVLGLFKIVVDTVLLFFLLRIRMEPLLTLRSVVSRLSRAGNDLSLRAPIKSTDEFGELASDLNQFLDRLNLILGDLGTVLEQVAALNKRLKTVQSQSRDGLQEISKGLAEATRSLFAAKRSEPLLSREWLETVKAVTHHRHRDFRY